MINLLATVLAALIIFLMVWAVVSIFKGKNK